MSPQKSRQLPEYRRALLAWYDENRRDLPWRRRSDAYAIVVSEIMLQQTRVETVIPYYERFLERFPDLEALASAKQEAVLASWSGLGYYVRARRLHALAERVVELGDWPRDAKSLAELPGIGPYTAAAVASIAFGDVAAVVDGNVERVLSRIDALEVDAKNAAGRRAIARRADELVDRQRPGDFNQAMMELGATICQPRRPLCDSCPWESWCEARRAGDAERYPIKADKARKTILVRWTMVIVRDRDRLLLFRRPDDDALLAGTWELPWVDAGGGDQAEELSRRYGGRWSLGEDHGVVRHSITHRRLEVRIREASWTSGESIAEGPEAGFFDRQARESLAMSSLVGKALKRASWEDQIPRE